MSYGLKNKIGGGMEKFGYASVLDWFESVLDSFPAPWKVLPLNGKYYGTVISDSRDIEILTFWEQGVPSHREKEKFGSDWSEESWSEYNCDSHYESEMALALANTLVGVRNARYPWHDSSELLKEVFCRARWQESIWDSIQCGGPDRRPLS